MRFLAVLALLLPTAAGGESGKAEDGKLWIPALAVYGSVLAPQAEATGKRAPSSGSGRVSLARRLRADDAGDRWLPALAVIVPVSAIAGAVASSADTDTPGEAPAAQSFIAAPVRITAIPAAPRGDPAGAAGDPETKDESERWVPAIAVFSGVLVQSGNGTAQSQDEFGYVLTSRTVKTLQPSKEKVEVVKTTPQTGVIDRDAMGGDSIVGPVVAGSAELMTPGLQFVPGRPRFFVHGDVAGYFGPDRDVAKDGAPDDIVLATELNIPAEAIKGQGIATSIKVDPVLYSAGAGIAFSFDALGRRFRIRPSFEWFREEVEVNGLLNQAFLTDTGRNTVVNNPPFEDIPAVPPEYVVITVEGSARKTYHGIGPGLEVEMDAARAGPFMLTVFVSGKAYKMLGDLNVEFEGETTDEFGTHTASWSFEKDPWSYQGNIGVRFRWLPE